MRILFLTAILDQETDLVKGAVDRHYAEIVTPGFIDIHHHGLGMFSIMFKRRFLKYRFAQFSNASVNQPINYDDAH